MNQLVITKTYDYCSFKNIYYLTLESNNIYRTCLIKRERNTYTHDANTIKSPKFCFQLYRGVTEKAQKSKSWNFTFRMKNKTEYEIFLLLCGFCT